MMRSPRTFGSAPHRALLRCGGDCLLGYVVLLFISALTVSLQSKHLLAPKVLADSAHKCGTLAGECREGNLWRAQDESGVWHNYSCGSDCLPKQGTDDPTPEKPTQVCCFSNGQFANCVLLSASECTVTAGRTEAVPFSGTSAMAQCNAVVNASGRKSCLGIARSSASNSASASSAPLTRCGDNTVQRPNSAGVNEECDWGTGNSDTLPNKCRKDCTFPKCGDGIVDDNFSAPGYSIHEECDNTGAAKVSNFSFLWGGTETCNRNCTTKVAENPLYMMFTVNPIQDSPLYMILPIDWQSIFFPFSNIAF